MKPGFILSVIALLFALPLRVCSQSIDSFSVEPGNGNTVWLQWSLSALNDPEGAGFEIQRSSDNIQWETIALQKALPSHHYRFSDTPGDSITYYRIVQHRGDGKKYYSGVKWIQADPGKTVFLWPNPANNVLHVKTGFTNGTIDITDVAGKWVRKIIITNFIMDISTTTLPKGIYFLQIRQKNGLTIQRFVKQ